ncbi:MAG: SARP family transcriptional regulator [Actinomycetota bacterium]|nr:SARP family transcriptional regulator [Actinomycetota bacterium]
MSRLAIHLLGKPFVEKDGQAMPPPRGFKAWGLLAYLLRTEQPPTRGQLVSLLFSEADDPFAALRWNLSAVRRLLGVAELAGDPVRLTVPPGTSVDVETLSSGSWTEALAVPGMEGELLEGMSFTSSPAFDIWLVTERRHLEAAAEAVLREAALARLGAGDARGAADLATRLVRINPLDENFQVLLVRSLAATGDGDAAARQVARCTELLRRELGIDPSPALAEAARTVTASPTSGPVSGRAAAKAQLEAGEAAIKAGAIDAGLQCHRRALSDARAAGDEGLTAEALVALGAALVHAARGRDEEAAAALHEALAVAPRADLAWIGAAASRELGYVELLQGRYERAQGWLARAAELADDVAERGRIASLNGSVLSDTAHYGQASEQLRAALRLSSEARDGRQVAYILSMLGRVHLLRGDLSAAADALDESLETAEREHWAAFTPWPNALRGGVDLATGDTGAAAERYEHAYALGCQVGDPCWEGIAARGMGLVAAARGEVGKALEWLREARRRCRRLPDTYLWVEVYTLDALCSVAVAHDLPAAPAWIEELDSLAGRTGMRELAARAYLHRNGLGDDSALAAARVLAAGIDNPALAAILEPPPAHPSEKASAGTPASTWREP